MSNTVAHKIGKNPTIVNKNCHVCQTCTSAPKATNVTKYGQFITDEISFISLYQLKKCELN